MSGRGMLRRVASPGKFAAEIARFPTSSSTPDRIAFPKFSLRLKFLTGFGCFMVGLGRMGAAGSRRFAASSEERPTVVTGPVGSSAVFMYE